MGIKIAAAMGCEVTAISTTASKEAMAREMGATHFVVISDPAAAKAAAGSLDIILDTVSANHEMMPYADLLASDGQLTLIGRGLTGASALRIQLYTQATPRIRVSD